MPTRALAPLLAMTLSACGAAATTGPVTAAPDASVVATSSGAEVTPRAKGPPVRRAAVTEERPPEPEPAFAPEDLTVEDQLSLCTARIDVEAATRAFLSRESEIAGCYQRALREDAAFRPSLVVTVRIDAEGHGRARDIRPSDLPAAFAGCLAGLVSDVEFPEPGGAAPGRCVTLEMPLQLSVERRDRELD